jgi:hypothetical protein
MVGAGSGRGLALARGFLCFNHMTLVHHMRTGFEFKCLARGHVVCHVTMSIRARGVLALQLS